MKGTLNEDQYTFSIISRSILRRMKNISDELVENLETHILCSITFFRKVCRLPDIVEKYCTAIGQATDDNMADPHCMLDT
jgi:hypothetical protein